MNAVCIIQAIQSQSQKDKLSAACYVRLSQISLLGTLNFCCLHHICCILLCVSCLLKLRTCRSLYFWQNNKNSHNDNLLRDYDIRFSARIER